MDFLKYTLLNSTMFPSGVSMDERAFSCKVFSICLGVSLTLRKGKIGVQSRSGQLMVLQKLVVGSGVVFKLLGH